MAEWWIRAGAGPYGAGDGTSFEDAWTVAEYNAGWKTTWTAVTTGDVIYIDCRGVDGAVTEITGEQGLRTRIKGITFDGQPPGAPSRAVFDQAASGQAVNGDPAFSIIPDTTAFEGDNTVLKNIVLKTPNQVGDGALVTVAGADGIVFRNCSFVGNGQAPYSISNGKAIMCWMSNYQNKAGQGGTGKVTLIDCDFTDFGSRTVECRWGGTAPTFRRPNRFICVNSTFTRCIRAIFWKGQAEAVLDTYYKDPSIANLDNGVQNQFLVVGSTFISCGDWVIDHQWADPAHSGFDCGIKSCAFYECGDFYTGDSANVIQTHGNQGGEIIDNLIDTWYAGAYDDGSAFIADHYIAADSSLIGIDHVYIARNTFRNGRTHPSRLLAEGDEPIDVALEDRPKAIGLWNGQNCVYEDNIIVDTNIGIRIAPDARNVGNVFRRNLWQNNRVDYYHRTGGLTASPAVTVEFDAFLGGAHSQTGEATAIYLTSGSPTPEAPIWNNSRRASGVALGVATDIDEIIYPQGHRLLLSGSVEVDYTGVSDASDLQVIYSEALRRLVLTPVSGGYD